MATENLYSEQRTCDSGKVPGTVLIKINYRGMSDEELTEEIAMSSIRPHDLRHSFCEWCITNGVDPKTVSGWMGHSDQKMIMQVYDHVTNERETKAIEKLNTLFKAE